MKKVNGFAMILILLLSMNGCGKNTDFLKFVYEKSASPATELASYEVNMGNNVGGGTVVAELWENGECIKSSPVSLNNQTKEVNLSLLINGYGTFESEKNLNVEIDTNEVSGSVLTAFELPKEINGYSFTAYEDKQVIEIEPNKEVILAAMAFDMGDGVRSVDCEILVSEPGRLSSYSLILVIRATFTSEQLEPQAEAEAEQ